jgi:hypothetical protein
VTRSAWKKRVVLDVRCVRCRGHRALMGLERRADYPGHAQFDGRIVAHLQCTHCLDRSAVTIGTRGVLVVQMTDCDEQVTV